MNFGRVWLKNHMLSDASWLPTAQIQKTFSFASLSFFFDDDCSFFHSCGLNAYAEIRKVSNEDTHTQSEMHVPMLPWAYGGLRVGALGPRCRASRAQPPPFRSSTREGWRVPCRRDSNLGGRKKSLSPQWSASPCRLLPPSPSPKCAK